MQRVRRGKLIIHAIKDVLLISFIVEHHKLGRIEKTAGIEPIQFEKVSPVFSPISDIETSRRRPEGSVGTGEAAGGLGNSLAGARRHLDHQARLASILRRRRTRDDFHRLNRV